MRVLLELVDLVLQVLGGAFLVRLGVVLKLDDGVKLLVVGSELL